MERRIDRLSNWALGLGCALGAWAVTACGPSLEGDRVLSPEERIQEQERLAYEAEQAKRARGEDPSLDLEDPEDVQAFDKQQAEMELKRASLSAATCPNVVEGKHPKGIADVSITFVRDGSVRDASLAAPFGESAIAECILTAYKAVIVPPFKEPEFVMAWQLDLSAENKKKKK